MIGLAGFPWRLAGYGLVALAASGILLGGFLSVRGAYKAKGRLAATELALEASEKSFEGYRKASEQAMAAWAAQDARDKAQDAALAARLDAIETAADELRLAASRIRPTREVRNEDGTVSARIDPDWWLCVSASASGDAADAAACKARADAAVRPAEGGAGVQVPP